MPTYYMTGFPVYNELYHHGIKNQKWGFRRYQNADGTLTDLGKIRYRKISDSAYSKATRVTQKYDKLKTKLDDAKQKERTAEAEKLSLENMIYDTEKKAKNVASRGEWLERHFSIDTGSKQKSQKILAKAERLASESAKANYRLNEIKKYRLDYENEVSKILDKIQKYNSKGDLYKSLAEEGVTKRYAKKNNR